MELEGVTTRSVEPIHTGSSKVDIFLELFEATDGSVVGHIEYDSSLWQRSSIVAFAAELNVSPLLEPIAPCMPVHCGHVCWAVTPLLVLLLLHADTCGCICWNEVGASCCVHAMFADVFWRVFTSVCWMCYGGIEHILFDCV